MSEVLEYLSYFGIAFNQEILIEKSEKVLKDSLSEIDCFVGTGLSGASVIPILAKHFNKKFVFVRKNEETSHSFCKIAGILGRRWLFVDDFISTGDTFYRVYDAIIEASENNNFPTVCVGAFLYENIASLPDGYMNSLGIDIIGNKTGVFHISSLRNNILNEK